MENRTYKKMKALYEKLRKNGLISDENAESFEKAFEEVEKAEDEREVGKIETGDEKTVVKEDSEKVGEDFDKAEDDEKKVEEEEKDTAKDEDDGKDDIDKKVDEKLDTADDKDKEPAVPVTSTDEEKSDETQKALDEMNNRINELFKAIKHQDVGIPAQGGKFISANGAVSEFK